MKLIIIIPAFNESKNIDNVIKDIKTYAGEYDYIIVNDCSSDNTLHICKEKGYNVIDLPVNLGIGGCVQAGYKYAYKHKYDFAVQFDGDGQHNAKYIPGLLECIEKTGADMVIGSRFINNKGFQSTPLRRFGINLLSMSIAIMNRVKITDPTSGFRLVNNKIIKEFCEFYPSDYPEPESTSDILRKGFKVAETPVVMNERAHGISSIGSLKSIYYMAKVLLAIFIGKVTKKERVAD